MSPAHRAGNACMCLYVYVCVRVYVYVRAYACVCVYMCTCVFRTRVCVHDNLSHLIRQLDQASVLQCVAVCCSVLQCVAVRCSVLQ